MKEDLLRHPETSSKPDFFPLLRCLKCSKCDISTNLVGVSAMREVSSRLSVGSVRSCRNKLRISLLQYSVISAKKHNATANELHRPLQPTFFVSQLNAGLVDRTQAHGPSLTRQRGGEVHHPYPIKSGVRRTSENNCRISWKPFLVRKGSKGSNFEDLSQFYHTDTYSTGQKFGITPLKQICVLNRQDMAKQKWRLEEWVPHLSMHQTRKTR